MAISLSLPLKTVLLGTPSCALRAFEVFYQHPNLFDIVSVVTKQPTLAPGRSNPQMSPVGQWAQNMGIPVLTPLRAREGDFLQALRNMKSQLCITAAYGLFLPQVFLDIPTFGTINIHPSLLPLYRGAAPVQRALQDGHTQIGISLVKTVLAMDAGPIFHQESVSFSQDVQAPQVLDDLFERGAQNLLSIVGKLATIQPVEQDHSLATLAPKVSVEERDLHLDRWPATVLHHRIRAFFPWPGSVVSLYYHGKTHSVRLIKTQSPLSHLPEEYEPTKQYDFCFLQGQCLMLRCAGNTFLPVTHLQLPGKPVVTAQVFWNGLGKDKKVSLPPL